MPCLVILQNSSWQQPARMWQQPSYFLWCGNSVFCDLSIWTPKTTVFCINHVKHSKNVSYCLTCWHALSSGCLGHGFRIRLTWQHGFLKTKQNTWVYAQNCCLGCSNGQITENWISTSKKLLRAVATFWLAAVNLNFEELPGKAWARHGLHCSVKTAQLVGTSWD